MTKTKYGLIKQAIQTKQQVVAMYLGDWQEMCPHVLGLKDGEENCWFYLFGGTSSSAGRNLMGWRCMKVGELSNVSIRPGPWHTDPRHSRPQTCVDEIDVEVT